MTPADSRALRLALQREFPDLELSKWYMQYREIKAGYADAVLLYRFGDFYETFDDDAKLAAELLDVTLTYKDFAVARRGAAKQRCPMAGMPYHAIEGYVGRLVGAGYRVAIAEQISETASSKADTRPRSVFASGLEQSASSGKLVERKVVRVITPGTVIDSTMLAAEQNNYLAALIAEGERIGLAYADLSTGEFYAAELTGARAAAQALGELARLRPAEVLVPDKAELRLPGIEPASSRLEQDLEFLTKEERELLLPGERIARRMDRENDARWANGAVTALPLWRWERRTAGDALLQQFAVGSLAGFGLTDRPLAVRAAGALVQYVSETQPHAHIPFTTLRTVNVGEVMFLDPQTRRNLELLESSSGKEKGSLVQVLDQTRTPMGARLLRRWVQQPLLALDQLALRQDAVQHFFDDPMQRAIVRDQLRHAGDMERVVNRVVQGAGVATPRDMARLREGLRSLPEIVAALGGWLPQQPPPLAAPAADERRDDPSLDPGGERIEAAPPAAPVVLAPSLRERRESQRAVVARWASDDLFGDDDDAAPVKVQPRPPIVQPPAAPQPAAPRPPQPAAVTPGTLDPCADLLAFLERALDDEPPALLGASNYLRAGTDGEPPRRVIRPGFEAEIDTIVRGNREAQRYISGLEARERERTGIKSLRVDYNKVFGYYIEVSKVYADTVPADYIRKQTLSTGERYYTEELKEVEDVLTQAKERLAELERRAFAQICETIAAEAGRLLVTARLLAEIDVYAALGEAAVRGSYVRPTLHDDTRLVIVGGRHPVVEQSRDIAFVANDTTIDAEREAILIVTGPNMSGKSTVMRQIALIVLMAQIGSFVPAARAEVGLVDRIFTRIGAQDDIATGQSTFMVEMTETAALLAQGTRRSLVILDEVGRGTSTYDGMAIAQALIEYLHNEPRLGCRTLFATHYHELTELDQQLPRVRNYHMAAVEQDQRVVFLHELRPGGADRSYGIHVAELAGIPRQVIGRASELLDALEAESSSRTPAAPPSAEAADAGPRTLFDIAPSPVIEMIRRMNLNELTPLDALNRLYELQKLARA